MKTLLLLVVAAGLTACGDDGRVPAPNSDRLIRECAERGGHAAFSQDQYGNVYFIVCEEP